METSFQDGSYNSSEMGELDSWGEYDEFVSHMKSLSQVSHLRTITRCPQAAPGPMIQIELGLEVPWHRTQRDISARCGAIQSSNASLDFCLRVVALFDHKGVLMALAATGWGVENIEGFKKEISRLLPP